MKDRPRTDKAWGFHIANIEKHPEFQQLNKFARFFSYIPFELNAKSQAEMQVQITETFEVNYFDRDHQFIKLRRDNAPMVVPQDTGIKMTALFVINKDDKSDREYG